MWQSIANLSELLCGWQTVRCIPKHIVNQEFLLPWVFPHSWDLVLLAQRMRNAALEVKFATGLLVIQVLSGILVAGVGPGWTTSQQILGHTKINRGAQLPNWLATIRDRGPQLMLRRKSGKGKQETRTEGFCTGAHIRGGNRNLVRSNLRDTLTTHLSSSTIWIAAAATTSNTRSHLNNAQHKHSLICVNGLINH